ncbi:MAG: hypothetical protein ACLPSM_15280 [Acidimicrobiales bacterium]|jgi:hypothetical protein
MHKLRHPITMFTVAVLIVIAIGVGVVAATQNSKVYGPSWGRFTAAFPGPVCGLPFPIPLRSAMYTETSPIYFETSTNLTHKCAIDWTRYAPLVLPSSLDSVEVYSQVAATATQGYVRLAKIELFHKGVREDVQNANGFVVTTLGPECMSGSCRVAEYVSNGRVLWTLMAISPGSGSKIESFLNSFAPIG